MWTLAVCFSLSFALSLLVVPLARKLAGRYGLTDKPDQRRKLHGEAIPVAGGLAVLLAMLIALPLVIFSGYFPWEEDFAEQSNQWLGLAGACLLIAVVGVLDDLGFLRGRHKLLGQFCAICVLMATGLVVQNIRLGSIVIDLGILAIPFTAFFLLGAINSLNLLDGMDGLLGTVALIVTIAFAGIAAMTGKWTTACVAITMAGALVGFLRYNLPPASIYLGDSGSMLIGLVIGALAIKSSLKGPATFALAAPVAVLIVPILDSAAAIFRRKLTGRSIFTTDRGHLHHCLLSQGLSKTKVLLLVASICLLAVSGAYLCVTLDNEWLALVGALAVAILLIGTKWFGHGETMLVINRLKGLTASFLKIPGASGPKDAAIRLQGSGRWEEPWGRLSLLAKETGLRYLRLDINAPALHESYTAWCGTRDGGDGESGDSSWRVSLPLHWKGQNVGSLEAVGLRDEVPLPKKIEGLMDQVEELEETLARIADQALAAAAIPKQPPLPQEAFAELTLSK